MDEQTNKQPDFEIKERLWSGNSTLYTDEPIRSFVVEVELTSNVDGGILQEAVDDVLARAPYFADALVERDGTFYYAKNPLPFEVAEGSPRAIAGPETNWHCVDVTYEGTVMSFAMYHPYCDGLGLNIFIEATLNRYFSRKDGVDYPAEGLRVPGQAQLPGEEADAISHGYDAELTPEMAEVLGRIRQKCYAIPEAAGEHLNCVHAMMVHISEAKFIDFVRSCGSSPAPTLSAIMANTVFAVHPECDEPITALIPFSTRKALGLPNTFKNTSNAAFIRFDPKEHASSSFAEVAQATRAALRSYTTPELIRFMANASHQSFAAADELKGFAAKRDALNRLSAYVAPISVDYVGGLRSEGFEEQIVDVRYLAMPVADINPGISLFVTATAGAFNLMFARTMATDVYDKAFLTQLDELGIDYDVVGEMTYATPRSGLLQALGLA
jgi:hypothetical protein